MTIPVAAMAAAVELADDAATLALLHEGELPAQFVADLRTIGFPDNLSLVPATADSRAAADAMRLAVQSLPVAEDRGGLDALAADYAAIYLTGAYDAWPCESVWLDDDHLICQRPMFELRTLYGTLDLAVRDWRRQPDDHLATQLRFVAHLLGSANRTGDASMLAGFLDDHLLRWLPDFAARVRARAGEPFYRALAPLTEHWCRDLRALLGERAAASDAQRAPRPATVPRTTVAPIRFVRSIGSAGDSRGNGPADGTGIG